MNKILSILVLSLFISPICFAKGGGHKHHKKIFKQLDLSKEQKQSLESIRKEQGNVKELKSKKKELREAMNAAMMGDASESELRELHSKISSIKAQMKDKRFENMLKIRKILSPEQRKTFFEMKRKMRKGKRKGQHH